MARLFFASLILVYAAAAVAETPQASAYSDQTVINRVAQADLEMIVTSIKHTIEARQTLGEVSLIARTQDGLLYLLIGTACEPEPDAQADAEPVCYGLNMQVRYGADEYVTLKKINAANLAHVAVTVWRVDDTLGISRFVILDGGQTIANIKENLFNLLGIAPYVVDVMWPSEAVSSELAEDEVITLTETGE